MVRWMAFLTGLAVCWVVGYASANREARAVDPPHCPKFECVNTHAYWSATDPANVWGYLNGADDTKMDVQSEIDIFTPSSDRKKPQVKVEDKKVWKRVHDACYPLCGIDPGDKKWQSIQTVVKAGKLLDEPKTLLDQYLCTPVVGLGPMVDPKNNNPKGAIPPQPPK